MKRTFLHLAAALATAVATGRAQHLIAYDPPPGGGGMMAELQLPTVLFPGPMPPAPIYPIAPLLPAAPLAVAQPGDSTFDSIAVLSWYTNGGMLATMPTPSFPAGPVMPPFPIAPAVLAALGGPVTGIAIDPVANIMYLGAAPGVFLGVTPIPGTPVVVPPFAPPFAMGPVSGLEWDGITGTLLCCDIVGTAYQFFPGGAAFGPPTPSPFLMPAPAGDIAIDKTGIMNPLGLRPIHIVAGPVVFEITNPAAPPLPTALAAPCGLAFLPKAAASQPVGCPCGPLLPQFGTNSPMLSGNAGFAITVRGVPPGSAVIELLDFRFNPAFPLINVTGCGLGLLGTPALMINFSIANPAGVATWPLPLTFLPPGAGPAFDQALFPCPIDPTGWTLTNTQHLAVCGW